MGRGLKNNEGFSLVEMVVVVLIIAILAVALAPQVIKWIEHSRNSSDEQTKNTLLEYASFALTEEEAFKMVKDGEYEIHIVKDINGTTYTYMDKNGTHVGAANVDQTDPYWANLLKCVGVSSLEKLEEETRIKSTPEPDHPIEIEILVYIGGYTYGKLKGIENATLGIVNADS